MMRSLWTAASGMIGQQTNLDVIANNLSNINTTGYKTQAANFKTLIYQNLQKRSTTTTGAPKPVGAQVGLGTRVGAVSSDLTQGALLASNGEFDVAIQGKGFFMVHLPDGTTAYTRNGHFNVSITDDGIALSDSEGNPVLDTQGREILLPNTYRAADLKVDQFGNLTYPDERNNQQYIGVQIGLAYFPNPGGLDKGSGSTYLLSDASGPATIYTANELGAKIKSGYLEGSNVQAADEMVNMIIAQRAYEMNSKAIIASDEMLQQANNLRQ